MKPKHFFALALPLAAAAALALTVACGGGGDDEGAAIRIEKGPAVAALTAQDSSEETAASGGGAAGAAVGVPAPVPALPVTVGRGGDVSYEQPVPGGGFSLFQQQAMTGIFVQGFGSATVDATSASLQLFVVGQGVYEKPIPMPAPVPEATAVPPYTPDSIRPELQAEPLTEEDLAPIVAAIKGQGVADSDIEVTMNPGGYYDPYGPGRASITATIDDPRDRVQPIAEAARAAADGSGILYLESVSVLYSASPQVCATLEQQSMQAAVEDARDRGQLLAQVLGVGMGDVVFASHYSYSPFGPSPCDPSAITYPKGYVGGYPFDPSQPAEVTLISNVSIAYAIQ